MASLKSKFLWKKSIPLSYAWTKYAPEELRKKYDRLSNPKEWIIKSDSEKILARGLDIFVQITYALKCKSQIEDELKCLVNKGLLDGDLVAYGYRESPSRSNGPVRIDISSTRSIDVDWKYDRLETYDHVYNRVGILNSNEAELPFEQQSNSKPINAIGSIKTAIDTLIENNPEFIYETRKMQAHLVRKYLNVCHDKYDGYSDKNIAKHLRDICGLKRKIPK